MRKSFTNTTVDRHQEWRNKNLEHRKQYEKEYREKHKEHYNEYFKNYRETHREEERVRTLEFYHSNTKFRRKLTHNSLIAILGGKCKKCGSTEDLQIDHILGGGGAERKFKFAKSNYKMYRYYIDHPKLAKHTLQALCRTHNQEKRSLRKEFGLAYSLKSLDPYYSTNYKHNH